MKRGRPPKAIYIPQYRVIALCAGCPLRRCVGTGDARCPVRVESRKRWSRDNRNRVEYQRKRYLAKKETQNG